MHGVLLDINLLLILHTHLLEKVVRLLLSGLATLVFLVKGLALVDILVVKDRLAVLLDPGLVHHLTASMHKTLLLVECHQMREASLGKISLQMLHVFAISVVGTLCIPHLLILVINKTLRRYL